MMPGQGLSSQLSAMRANDGALNGLGAGSQLLGRLVGVTQNGLVRTYAAHPGRRHPRPGHRLRLGCGTRQWKVQWLNTNFPWLTVLVALPSCGRGTGFVPPPCAAGRVVALGDRSSSFATCLRRRHRLRTGRPRPRASLRVPRVDPADRRHSGPWPTSSASSDPPGSRRAARVLIAGWDENRDRGAYPALVSAPRPHGPDLRPSTWRSSTSPSKPCFDPAVLHDRTLRRRRRGHEAALLYSLFGGSPLGGVLFICSSPDAVQHDRVLPHGHAGLHCCRTCRFPSKWSSSCPSWSPSRSLDGPLRPAARHSCRRLVPASVLLVWR